MLKITDENYDEYKKIANIFSIFLLKLSNMDPYSEHSPIRVLEDFEKRSKSLAKKGLKAGLIDEISDIRELSKKHKEEIDIQLTQNNLPSLAFIIGLIADTPEKVLKRGKIKNMDEYYIIKEILCDLQYEISMEKRDQLNEIFDAFESE